jgi:DNA-binding MarR family transcriptional regulator
MTELVSYLEKHGYVYRTRDPGEGRAWIIRFTERGAALRRVVRRPVGPLAAAGAAPRYPGRMSLYVVRLRRGGPWDWSLDLRHQVGWDEHARFMDGLVDAGFILLGGPLEGGRDTLHIVEAESEAAIRDRLAEDPWAGNGMLTPASIERWTVLLDGLGLAQRATATSPSSDAPAG